MYESFVGYGLFTRRRKNTCLNLPVPTIRVIIKQLKITKTLAYKTGQGLVGNKDGSQLENC